MTELDFGRAIRRPCSVVLKKSDQPYKTNYIEMIALLSRYILNMKTSSLVEK